MAVQFDEEGDVVTDGHPLVDADLLGQVADLSPIDERGRRAVPGDRAGIGLEQPHRHADRGGFAGTVGSEEADHLAGGQVERHVVDGGLRAEAAREMVGGQGHVPSVLAATCRVPAPTRIGRMVGAGLPRWPLVASAPTSTSRRDRAFLLVLVLLLVIGAAAALTRKQTGAQRGPGVAPAAGDSSGNAGSAALAALRYRPGNDDEYAERAAQGFSHPLYAQVPGGAVATAERVSRWRKLIEQATDVGDSPVDADTLEALVYLESAGRRTPRRPARPPMRSGSPRWWAAPRTSCSA